MMTDSQIKLLGISTFAVLFGLAGVFYLERIGHIDMAFQTFLILKSGSLEIQSGRFGAAVTQVWPWAAQALGLPLPTVLLAYSLGHVLWPALVFGWCCWLRAWPWAVVLLLVVVGMPTHTFYWLSEMPQGLVFLVGLLAWINFGFRVSGFGLRFIVQSLAFIAAVVTAFYFHPLVLYAAVFGCLFFMLEKSDSAKWPLHGAMLGVLAATIFVKYNLLKLDWYDAVAVERAEAFGQLWPHWFDLPSHRDLLRYCTSDYWFLPAGLLASVGFYVWEKRWLKAALVGLYPLGYVLLVNIPFHESSHQFYMENLWLPLGLFAALPLVFDVLPGLLSGRGQFIVLALVLTASLLRIGLAHRPWSDRLAWEQHFLNKTAQFPTQKLLLTEQQVPLDTLKLVWGTPYEFLLLSALASPDSARCILVTNEPQRYDTLLTKPRLFLGTFKNYPYEQLPERYFRLRDTTAYGTMNDKL